MTKIPIEILKLAVEGGWQPWPSGWGDTPFIRSTSDRAYWRNPITGRGVSLDLNVVALDREFWRCLGISLGWPMYGRAPEDMTFAEMKAHEFYQCILSGQDPTEYWAQLTAKDN